MATSQEYTISRKVSDTEEEIIQIPYGSLANKPDLSVYQTKNDASLKTNDKTVVGAINEVVTGVAETLESFGMSLAPQENGKLNKKVYVYPDGYLSQGTSYDASKDLYLSIGDGLTLETIDETNNIWNIKSASAITSVDGLGGGAISGDVSTSGNLTVGGSLTVNGTTTTVDSTTLQVKDKLIEVAHGNTTTLTTPAGLVAPKYDGTNSGALVFDSTGTAYVGDVTLKDGNIDVANSGLQPLATRTGLVGGNLVQYDSSAQTLKDSGKKISDLATTSQVDAKYTKPSGGIPKTDLASDVQTSLSKADTALQTHQDISGKANLSGGNTFSGIQTINAPTNVSGSEQTTMKVKTSNGGAIIFGKEGANSGTMIRLDQTDGTCRLRFRSSKTAGAMVWEQPEQGAKLHVDLGKDGSDKHRVTFPSSAGTLALTSQVNAKYTKPSGGIPKTDLASDVQTSLGKADTSLQLDGGTINKSKTIKMDASANSDGANLKWGTVNSKNPYIGYASDQVDGTFVVGSLLGTNYASGLAIGGGSGNLLWKGTKVATINDIPTNYVTTDTDWQEITSKKKFYSNQIFLSNAIDIDASAPAPEANKYRYIDFLDKNEKRIGIVGALIDKNKRYGAYLQAGNVASMGVSSTPDGFGYSYGPIPPDKDNTNKLATTGWVLGNTSFIPFYSDSLSTGTYRSTNLPSGCSLVYIEDRQRGLSGYLYKNSGAMEFHELYFVTNFYTTVTDAKTNLTIYKLKINGTQVEKTYKNLFVSSSGAVEVGTEYAENGTFYYKVLK